MRYFTPDLYLRFNSEDQYEADVAEQEWETAVRAYRGHLVKIKEHLSSGVRAIADSLCLHNAVYLGLTLQQIAESPTSVALLHARQESQFVFLLYLLAEEPLIHEATSNWPFSEKQVHWLYDEFDVADNGLQEHRILLSNGRVMTITFYDLLMHKLNVPMRSAVA